MKRTPYVVPLIALATLVFLLITLRAGEHLSSVPLTTEESISLAKTQSADVQDRPSKFEWILPEKRFVRYVIEERDSKVMPWHSWEATPYNMAVNKGLFIFQITDKHSTSQNQNVWTLETRIGGNSTLLGMPSAGWAGSRYFLPVALGETISTSQSDDLDNVYVLTVGQRQYRIRLESSQDPFPGTSNVVR
ncbi:MAG TPA: hypothetical protein VFE25_06520 [Opitutaceae bacterium]|nr:hypothetical protein [Opitutaceae bacterium]